ncbi:hypothetical protein UA08_07924 [Talaromyces atroroseus]|uniref:Amine oxidase domain-containing protein n=1 Tax=Talaromyces atroroseus TaxID=1441469 RepID=A0A225A9N4_TALAT|nr:hypothetical protein UA08_07924 [Talaromyces atroroseus]OKL56770.1 hypothetical protein UA08_07924 [Talaromyces atroroseus]
MPPEQRKKKVAVIGAGAAGMSCAATLAKHPDKFDVIVFETAEHVGGQATSIDLDPSRYGASWLNDGVQGGSAIFRYTFNFFRQYRHEPQEVKLQVSFGKGKGGFWTNVFPSPLVDNHSAEIKKLGKVLKWIKYTLFVTGVMPVKVILRLFRFSFDFRNKMVLPLLALFLGTGNQTPNVPSALLERLFDDPNMRLWDYDPDTLLPNLPSMYTFPNLGNFYRDWTDDLCSKGVKIKIPCEVEIVERDVTHSDSKHFHNIFENRFREDLCAKATSKERKDQILFATSEPQRRKDGWIGFQPMYYTHSYATHPDKIEMGFDCTNYQYQFRENLEDGSSPPERDRHMFQTIFLNDVEKDLWTIDSIDEDKVICRKWWCQWGHRWQHYLRVVPGLMFINGKNHTLFGGSWTLVNMHEVACVSGIAAAYRLGATYEAFDEFAEEFFAKYLLLTHGVRYKPSGRE